MRTSSPQLLIVFATFKEAEKTIELLRADGIENKRLYRFERGYVLITGVGAIAAAQAVAQHLDGADEVWNWGLAGSLHKELEVGKTYRIKEGAKYLSIPSYCDAHARRFAEAAHPTLTIAKEGLNLITTDYPVNHPELRKELAKTHDLVDMEGYGVSYACKQENKPCIQWKTVSDLADENSAKHIQEKIGSLSQKIANEILTFLNGTSIAEVMRRR